MASTIDRSSGRIIYKAARNQPFPQVDVLTLLFDHPACSAIKDTVVHASAADPSQRVTKSRLRSLVTSTAHVLRHRYGIGSSGPGKDVCLCIATGHFQMPTLFYATIAADGVFSASNPGSTPKELAVQLSQVKAKLVFCTEETKPTALAAAKLVNLPPSRVLVFSSEAANPSNLTLSAASTNQPIPISSQSHHPWTRITSPQILSTIPICILFSSGTTGPPKGCKLSHQNIVSEATLVLDPLLAFYRSAHPSISPTKRRLATIPTQFRTIAHLPAAHIAGIQGYLVNQFYLGGTTYWMPKFDFPQFLTYAKKYKMTQFFSVPPVFLAIAKSPLVTDHFDSVDFAISGAAPMGKDLQSAAKKKLGRGKASLSQTWGLSETTGSITAMCREWLETVNQGEDDLTGSVSFLISNAEARIVGEEGKDVQPGERGEIWVRGPNVVTGYWENDEADKQAFCEDELGGEKWFMTGDVALWKEENGMFYIVDRKKELIKYKGNQVAPAELEALLVTHDKILDAAVIGVEREGTEVPRAYVVPVDPKAVTADQIIDWVAGQVSNHKRLRGGVVFVEAIPKSPSGKILRKDLRELAKKEAAGGTVASKL